MDVPHPGVLVVHHLQVLALESGQHVAEGVAAVETYPHRQGVDEHADHPLDARHLRRAAGDDGAEHHVLPAGEHRQQERPGTVYGAGEGEAGRAQPGGERLGRRRGQFEGELLGMDDLAGRVRGDQAGRRVDAPQRPAPGLIGGPPVLPGQEREVFAERGDRRQHGGVAAVPVHLQQLAQEHRRRPAVEQDVVEGAEQAVRVVGEAHEPVAHQRRPGEVEGVGLLLRLYPLQLRGPHVLPERPQVVLPPRHVDGARDHLDRAALLGVEESGTQVGVPVQQRPGGGPEHRGVEAAAQVQHHLHGVDVVARLVVQRVEEKPLLQR
ncbi:hypothetical protein SGRI78S_04630 [Streptomyces griseus subsp. griseus]